jgi:hypothetical protein
VTCAKSNLNAHRVYSAPTDRTGGVIADQTIALDGTRTRHDYTVHLRLIRFRYPETGKALVFSGSKAPSDQAVLWRAGKRREDANLDRGVGICLGRHRPQTAEHRGVAH